MTKVELISKIKKDTDTILNLWTQAKEDYAYCIARDGKTLTFLGKRINSMRNSMNAIVKIALDDYGKQDTLLIAETFSNFYDFLYWYLESVNIKEEWNEMENYWHKKSR